jgi:arginase family enzyme
MPAQLAHHKSLLGIEVAELNPARDAGGQTTLLAIDLLQAGLTGRTKALESDTTGAKE